MISTNQFSFKLKLRPFKSDDDFETVISTLQKKWLATSIQSFDGETRSWLSLAHCIIPPLTSSASKGQAGRVAVVGGSLEYTGAPYFAAESALLAGMDLVHIFCEKSAGTAIKGYSPELIVHPVLIASVPEGLSQMPPCKENISSVASLGSEPVIQWISRLDAVLLGPGLGRDPAVIETACRVIVDAAAQKKPIILDADGLFVLTTALQPGDAIPAALAEQVRAALGSVPVTLTPNVAEFDRLCQTLGLALRGEACRDRRRELAPQVARAVGRYVTLVAKGDEDVVSDGETTAVCQVPGSPRRCGGQGDVLAGLLLAMRTWSHLAVQAEGGAGDEAVWASAGYRRLAMAGAVSACVLARRCAEAAFEKHRRAMRAGDVLAQVGGQFEAVFPAQPPAAPAASLARPPAEA